MVSVFISTALWGANLETKHISDNKIGIDIVIIMISPDNNFDFGILDVSDSQKAGNVLSYWDSKRYSLMINGGYFTPEFTPVGLCKINGKFINKRKPKKLSGFVAIDQKGAINILTHSDDLKKYPSILQCGPYVIDPGGKVGIRSNDGEISTRTLIGKTYDNQIVIMISSPISLYDLANFIKKKIPNIERLLNLDGGPSTALKTGTAEIVNFSPVRNYIFRKSDQ
jgi:uncharacterized protein YigE (DUF2233 family)